MKRANGVSLIELLIVIVIIGIMVGVGIPSYRNYVVRAQRAEAKSTLLRITAEQEKFYLNNNTYTADPVTAPPVGLGIPASENVFYQIAIVAAPGGLVVGYTATATPAPGSPQLADARCVSFTINNQMVRSALDGGAVDSTAECWGR